MRNFTVQSLITLLVTSSALLLTPMRSDAQVDISRLAQVAKSCQEDVLSSNYYERMRLSTKYINFKNKDENQERITSCIDSRYHYSLVLTIYPWLASAGEILPGYPASVIVGTLAKNFGGIYHKTSILECIANENISSEQCSFTKSNIAYGATFRNRNVQNFYPNYAVNVCPSCVVAHDEVSGSGEEILKAFIKWFLTLEKAQRRELISLLGDGDEASDLRQTLINQSSEAVNEYSRVRATVQEQEQERRRQELLGN